MNRGREKHRGYRGGRLTRMVGWWLFLTAGALGTEPRPEAARVVIVANVNEPESVSLARFYAEQRAIPEENIVALSLPTGETIDWHEYVGLLHDPLQHWLIEHDWVDAIPMDLRDAAGRRKMAPSGHRIEYLVTVRGVPLKIGQTRDMPSDGLRGRPRLKTNQGAVDSELSLIVRSETRVEAFVSNPIFRKDRPSALDSSQVVRVARIDGPTFAAARAMIVDAIEVEQRGLVGRAMIDVGGPHKNGDAWLEGAAALLAKENWPPTIHHERSTLKATDRADGVALYTGWYAGNISGPFALPGYRFAKGAIALHIHSFSARTLRSSNGRGWCGPLIARGVAGTFGNVFEPYLEYTHQPHLVMRALLRGATLGEAAYYAMPVLSWQAVVLGDPLYRPIGFSLAEQWERRDVIPARLAAYLALREMNRMETNGDSPEAVLAFAKTFNRKSPSLVMALEIANRYRSQENDLMAVRELGLVQHLRSPLPDQWALIAEAAQMLSAMGEPKLALAGWQNLFAQDLPDGARLTWLREARHVATEARDFRLSQEWDDELARLTAE